MSTSAIIDGSSLKKGRFANRFFRMMATHFIAENLKIKPKYPPINPEKLGLTLLYQFSAEQNNQQDTEIGKKVVDLKEDTFMGYYGTNPPEVESDTILNLNSIYCINSDFTYKMWEYLRQPSVKDNIINANPDKNRYDNNNDLFIHIRLGDVKSLNPGLKYYEEIIKNIKYDRGYITSDTMLHPICVFLRKKYKLRPIINKDLHSIILFGSTCRNIIISNGTFSWVIGAFGFNSTVHYPDPTVKNWHDDIYFNLQGWIKHEKIT